MAIQSIISEHALSAYYVLGLCWPLELTDGSDNPPALAAFTV